MPSSLISLCPSFGSLLVRYGDFATIVMGQRTNESQLTCALLVTAGANRPTPHAIADPFNEGGFYPDESVMYSEMRLPLTGANVAALRATGFLWTAEATAATDRFPISEDVVRRIAVASRRLAGRRQDRTRLASELTRPGAQEGAGQLTSWVEELVDEVVDWS